MEKKLARALVGALAVAAAAAVAVPAFAAGQSHGPRPSDITCTSPGGKGPGTSPYGHPLEKSLQKDIARAIGTHKYVAVALTDPTAGVQCAFRANSEYDSASMVKPSILAALLYAEHGKLTPGQQAEATNMIENSDNTAATALWKDLSDLANPHQANTESFRAFLTAAGMQETTPAPDQLSWGLTRTTASDELKLLDLLNGTDNKVLDGASRAYILDLMRSVRPDERWGSTDEVPAAASTAVKNGWLQRSMTGPDNAFDRGDWKVNSISTVSSPKGGPYQSSLVVLTEDNRVPAGKKPFYGFKRGVDEIQAVASAVNKDLYPKLADSQRYTPQSVQPST
ncbi:serine hydrolase [Streptomyces sp. NBC_01264]|uniref:serine hydrolase n=1 Tax=Streptomyces sp. NBC_01264 TaxID=2903804 RepID=UPI00224D23C0|nr:serine hydrolase [Streptomyces sp. NBC_01264]MCX4775461.1 class A beta-lactamase-related serine hydrolase [Streptomyces sp. NBC_01264]